MNEHEGKTYLTVKEVVERLKGLVHPSTLANWRSRGITIPFKKVGGKVFYLDTDIKAFEDSFTQRPCVASRLEGSKR